MTLGPARLAEPANPCLPAESRAYWDRFYASSRVREVPEEPSRFARWVRNRIEPAAAIVELGCGSGRDTMWLASKGFDVQAFDFAPSAVARVREAAESRGFQVAVEELDLSRTEDVALAVASVRARRAPRVVYARFLLHSLVEEARTGLYNFSADALRGGGLLFLEFRADRDEGAEHLFGDDHYRAYLSVDEVIGELEVRGGQIQLAQTRRGWAPYRSEDPYVSRVVARWT